MPSEGWKSKPESGYVRTCQAVHSTFLQKVEIFGLLQIYTVYSGLIVRSFPLLDAVPYQAEDCIPPTGTGSTGLQFTE